MRVLELAPGPGRKRIVAAVTVAPALFLTLMGSIGRPLGSVKSTGGLPLQGAATMHAAGFFGILADVTITAAALVIGIDQLRRKRSGSAFGWFLIGVRTVLFAIVDSLVGYVLSTVAAQPGGAAAFQAVKSLFNALFLPGTATFGLGAVLALGTRALGKSQHVPRALAIPALVIGMVGAIAGVACLGGADLHVLIGPSVAGNAVVFTLVGIQIARWRQ